MNITGAIVLFVVIWFLVFLMVLQTRPRSQADAGSVVPGTPSSAPDDPQIGRKAKITTMITTVLWAIISAVILSGAITIRDLDFFDRMSPKDALEAPAETPGY